jgi:hypothetical protein
MVMPASGGLNLAGTSTPVSVAQELGLGLTTTISMNQAAVRTLAGAGGSGTSWSMSSLYGKSNAASVITSPYFVASAAMNIEGAATARITFSGVTGLITTVANAGGITGGTLASAWLTSGLAAGQTVYLRLHVNSKSATGTNLTAFGSPVTGATSAWYGVTSATAMQISAAASINFMYSASVYFQVSLDASTVLATTPTIVIVANNI